MTLPGEYKFGFVVGRFLQMVADTAGDIDPYPDPRPAKGTVTFTPHERQRKVSQDFTAFVGHATVGASLGNRGQIIDAEGRDGIWLIEGTHTVRVTNDAGVVVPDFDVTVTPDHTIENPLDLVTAAPPQPGPGITLQTLMVPAGGSPNETLVRDTDGTLVWMPVGEVGPKGDPGEPGAPGEDGHTPLLTWSGTALVVDGVTGPDLKGPKGDTGAPGALADASSYILTGPGRPDVPATTGGIITGSEPVGAEFRSTDGAGVGAWVWMKRPTGWVVTDGDTGWRDVTTAWSAPEGVTLRLRRVGPEVLLHVRASADVDTATIASSIEAEFSPPPEASVWAAPLGQFGRGENSRGTLGFTEPWYASLKSSPTMNANQRGLMRWPARDGWPSTLPGTSI